MKLNKNHGACKLKFSLKKHHMTKLGNLHFYSRGRGAVENPICLSKFMARLTVIKLIFTKKKYSH